MLNMNKPICKKPFMTTILIFLFAGALAHAKTNFPMNPDLNMTPGALCTAPDSIRYPSRMAYCSRDVTTDMKWAVINAYVQKFNFTIDANNRYEFKIDHFIPLCMGGANDIKNLWPQHKDVYEVTDELELVLCQLLAEGKITQQRAVQNLKFGKFNLDQVPALIKEADKLR